MNDEAQSPYQPPESDISSSYNDDAVQAVKLLSAEGRIGRVRYIAYGIAYTLIYYLLIGVAYWMTTMGLPQVAIMGMGGVALIAMLIVTILLTIQRCHDMDKSGWWTLVVLVPLLGILFFYIWPGTKGTNRFGPRTPDNNVGVILLACVFPLLMIVGILAAIAIPAYGSYVTKAQYTEVIQTAAPAKLAIDICYQDTKDLSACNTKEKLNLPDAAESNFVNSLEIDATDSSIVVTGSEAVKGATYILTPNVTEAGLSWSKQGTCLAAGLC